MMCKVIDRHGGNGVSPFRNLGRCFKNSFNGWVKPFEIIFSLGFYLLVMPVIQPAEIAWKQRKATACFVYAVHRVTCLSILSSV